ncbi:hypothetical protein GF345_01360 [Candidatus Woesearchaeota archaeon]|nr:hypothetical protein [Candidatus Woesearchaeota archaeon]
METRTMETRIIRWVSAIFIIAMLAGCQDIQTENNVPSDAGHAAEQKGIEEEQPESVDRLSMIPSEAEKVMPADDRAPPESYSEEYLDPVPLNDIVNTAGAEDSAFILPDGKTLYFFFTPDVDVPVEKQIIDRVTGIYVTERQGSSWSEPQRVILQDKGKVSLDGCLFVKGDKAWFCTAREGYTGLHWATAEYDAGKGKWTGWKVDDFNPDYEVGELHISADSNELYFHSSRPGGKGGLDIWKSEKVNGEWSEPEKIISPLAGEATIDSNGNVYFTHHFFDGDDMIEADIYVARKK